MRRMSSRRGLLRGIGHHPLRRMVAQLLIVCMATSGITMPVSAASPPALTTFMLGASTLAPAELPLSVGNYSLVGTSRFSRTHFDFTYRATITNSSTESFAGVIATVRSLSSATTVLDATINYGNVGPGASFVSHDTFTIRQDRMIAFNPADLVWSFTFNRPPAAQDDAVTGAPGQPVKIDVPGVLGNDTDPDGNTISASISRQPANGTVTLNSDGSFTYTPKPPTPVSSLNPKLKWSWTSTSVLPDSINVVMTPAVIDLNGDGVPDVVFGSTASRGGSYVEVGGLRALNGADGKELFTISDPALAINAWSQPAVGDMDGDGHSEIILGDSSGQRLIAFERDGTFKWRSPILEAVNWGGPAIADLDGDGQPEIVVGRQVLNADGTLRWTGTGGRGDIFSAAPRPLGSLSVVADIDLDGIPEVVAGNTTYRPDGTTKWQASVPDGYVALGNFDEDPFAEVVLVSGGKAWLLEHTGAVKWGPISIPGGGNGGPPTIADFDGDGKPEIGVAGASRYVVIETDGSIKWQTITQDGSSNVTGSSVFDFEGDGSAEVIYRDELKLRVYRGNDGSLLYETPMSSCTGYEYPLVADVDADGHAEIVSFANDSCGFGPQRGIYVFADDGLGWAPTRKIWNQHTYHVTNVNEDGTIPRREDINWLFPSLNNFRLNAYAPADQALADSFTYRASDGMAQSNEATVRITLQKPNQAPVITSVPVTTATTGQLYTYDVNAIDPDRTDVLAYSLTSSPEEMTIDASTGLISWTPTVGQVGTRNVTVRVTDSGGLYAEQPFIVIVASGNHAPIAQDDVYEIHQGIVTINFDEIDATASPVILDRNHYAARGVRITTLYRGATDGPPVVKAPFSGNGATSLPNSIGFGFDRRVLELAFVNPDDGSSAVTNFVSFSVGDLSGEDDPISASAFDLNGTLLATKTFTSRYGIEDFGILTFEIPGIHRILVSDESPSGASLDDLSFVKSFRLAKPGVLANDTDPDGDALTAAIIRQPANGTVALNQDGSFTYTPNPPPPTPSLDVRLQWSWTSSKVLPNEINVDGIPAVIDLNGDGVPDVVFVATDSSIGDNGRGHLRALRGDTGEELFTVTSECVLSASPVAVGDIDNDGRPEIIAADCSEYKLIAFEHDGTFKWRSPELEYVGRGAPSLADLDLDGRPEIVLGRQVLRSDGSLLWTGTGGKGYNFGGSLSIVADIDLDGRPEIVAGNTAYRADGSIYWQVAAPDGYTAVGNFNDDPFAEVVLVASGTIRLITHDGKPIWGPVPIPNGGWGGPPVVADFDGDGVPEIGVAGRSLYTVFESNGTVKWSSQTRDGSSEVTGSSVFDFNNDGIAEVLYRDETMLRIYRGSDGTILFQEPMSSCTWHEYPLVADVDADGHAEFVIGANNQCGYGQQRGLFVYENAGPGWVPTRKIWNQHSYHITNINENGTIPLREHINWLLPNLNNFRLNTFAPSEAADSFTYRASDGHLQSNEATVRFTPAPVNQAPVFTTRPPVTATAGQTYTYDVNAIDPDWTGTLTFSLMASPAGMTIDASTGLISWAPTAGQVGPQNVTVRVTDAGGLFAEQNFTVNVAAPPVCVPPPAGIVSWWPGDGNANDISGSNVLTAVNGASFGDGLVKQGFSLDGVDDRFEVADKPSLDITTPFTIDAWIKWTGAVTGDKYYKPIVAKWGDGNLGTASYGVFLQPDGRPVFIVSSDGTQRYLAMSPEPLSLNTFVMLAGVWDGSQIQLYVNGDIKASTPFSGPLFSNDAPFLIGGYNPAHTTGKGNLSGIIDEVELFNRALTNQEIQAIYAAGSAGKCKPQQPPINHAPVISSSPVISVNAGQTYAYDVNATDPNAGDVLSYSLTTAPTGMMIDPSTGMINWVPAETQVGDQSVTVKVTDPGGLSVIQSFIIAVSPLQVVVPGVTGLTQANAQTAITAANLTMGTITQASSDTVPAGSVISQNPSAGATVAKGSAVAFVVSTGPAPTTVPNVVGMTQANAQAAITAAQLTVGTITQSNSDTVPADTVISQAPAAGATVAKGSTVNLVVSAGPEPVTVPSVTGLPQAQAESQIVAALLTVGTITQASSDTVPAGTVISQNPAGNSSAPKGSAVNLVVSTGPAPATVPNLAGLCGSAIHPQIVAANLTVGTTTQSTSDTVPSGCVISQNPAAGSSVTKGSAVNLVISSGPAPVTVPNVTGLTQAGAEAALAAAGLTVGTKTPKGSTTVPAGSVISQNPLAGSVVPRGTAVSLEISSGLPQPVITSIRVTPLTPTITTSTSQQFAATAIFDNGTSQPLTSGITWQSSEPSVAFVTTTPGRIGAAAVGTATITASYGGATGSTMITVVQRQPNGTDPIAEITSPDNQATVTGPVPVSGTASDPEFLKYVLEIAPVGEATYTTILESTTPVVNGTLGTLDPTLLVNDLYNLRLLVYDRGGRMMPSAPVQVQIKRDLKVGNFTLAFQDANVPVACLPLTVTRVYDSRDKRSGDFGVGWRLDLQTMRLRETGTMGDGWAIDLIDKPGPFGIPIPTYVLYDTAPHKVALTLPDGHVEEFDLTPNPSSSPVNPIGPVNLVYTPRPGTLGSLAPVVSTQFAPDWDTGNVQLIDSDVTLLDPRVYRYTSREGTVFLIDKFEGVKSVQCTNGVALTVTPGGITHDSGTAVLFSRDGQGRITSIADPNGNSQSYGYDANGDLVSHTDAEGNTTRFLYNYNHGMIEIQDPRGVQPIRNEYDDAGRLTSTTDAFSKKVTYAHDLAARRESVTDRLGNVTVHAYDAMGNVISTTDPLGGVTTRTYDAFGNELTRTDPLGRTTTFTYDSRRNMLSETDPLGKTTGYKYNARNQLEKVTDPLGRETSNTYDAYGNLTQTTDPLGNVTTYTYDNRGLQTSRKDPLGNTTTYQYDADGRLTRETDAAGRSTDYAYDANGNRTSETRTRTAGSGTETLTTTFEYDRNNRLVKTTQPDGSTTLTQYNAIGKQEVTTDQLGRQTTYEYDEMGRLTKTTYPDGASDSSEFDAEGRRTASTDRAERTTTYTYDALGRLTQTTFPDNTSSSTTYDAAGQVTATTDTRGNTTTYEYDASGRRSKVTDPLGKATTFSYDDAGNQTKVTDANGNTVQFTYDLANRRTRTTYPDGTFDTVTYDNLGRQMSKTDQAGLTTQFGYDVQGRLTSVTDALGQVTTYSYDELGNQLTQTDAMGRTTSFAYDKLGRRVQRTLPLGMFETMGYDLAGNLTAKTDFTGKATTYAYDAANRLIAKNPDPSLGQPGIGFTYTASGQRSSMTDASGTTTYSYDNRDRLTAKATPQGTLSYTYDAAGNLASIRSSNPGGAAADYTWDKRNRLASVTDSSGATTYSYDSTGNLAGFLYPNGVSHTYTYNTLNRLTNLTVARGGTLAGYTYTLGPAGNRTAVTEANGRKAEYTYDNLYRLTSETISGDPAGKNGAIGYTYDKVGNRLARTSTLSEVPAQSFAYDANDRITTESYDANGNTLASGGRTFGYDFENRLTSADGGVRFVYDGDGNRVARTVGGVTTWFLVDTQNPTGYAQVLEEISGGVVQKVYTYGLKLISQRQAAGTSFYGYDGHGSVRLLTDASGLVTDTYDYDAFGNLMRQMGTTGNVYLYAGEQVDSSIQMYFLRARSMSAQLGRFMVIDLFSGNRVDPRSLHAYVYANNDPIDNIDPTGLFSLADITATTVTLDTVPIFRREWRFSFGSAKSKALSIFEGVFVQGHTVLLPLHLSLTINHSSLRIVLSRENWDAVLRLPSVATGVGAHKPIPLGNVYYLTIGAGGYGGKLVKGTNRLTDIKLSDKVIGPTRVSSPAQGGLVGFVASIFEKHGNYPNDLDYDFYPRLSGGGYNCNSYISGLLKAVNASGTFGAFVPYGEHGGYVPFDELLPGWTRPVPASKF